MSGLRDVIGLGMGVSSSSSLYGRMEVKSSREGERAGSLLMLGLREMGARGVDEGVRPGSMEGSSGVVGARMGEAEGVDAAWSS